EHHFLPAGWRLAAEFRRRQQRASGAPQVADVRAAVARALVEADAFDEAADVAAELHAEFDRARVVDVGHRGHRAGRPQARARAAGAVDDHGDAAAGELEVAAVVDRARPDGGLPRRAGRPLVAPRTRPRRRAPGRAAVHRDFDAGDDAAAVGGGAGDGDAVAAADAAAGGRRGDCG